MKPNIEWIVSHPIQYQVPLMRALAREPDFALEAVFASRYGLEPAFDPGFNRVVDFGVELLGGYQHRFASSAVKLPDPNRFFGLRARHEILGPRSGAAVLHGWRTCFMLQAAWECRRQGVPYMIRAETPIYQSRGEVRSWRSGPRDLLVRWLIARASVCLFIGTANRRFLESRGASAGRLVHMPYYVDDVSVRQAAESGQARRAEIRRTLGIPANAPLVVCVAKFIERKRQQDIIRAIALLTAEVHVIFIGSGSQEDECKRLAVELGVASRCHFAGFLSSPETWQWLGVADVFTLASTDEPWGLVVNEALVAGLPLVVSDEVGSGEDLVIPRKTGSVVGARQIGALADGLRDWLSGRLTPDRVEQRRLAAAHSLSAAVAGFRKAVAQLNLKSKVFPLSGTR